MGPVTALAGVCLQDVERGAHEGGKRLLASRLRLVSSKATHPPTYLPLHRLWARLSLVVIIVLFYGREEDDVARVAVRSGVGWAGTASSVDRVVPVGATVVNIVGSRAHRISAASHCTSAAFLRPSHFRKLRTTGLQMSSYVIPNAWILCKAMSSF